jgi:glycine/D-amino acid oxidase-like deaminating enzyme
LNVAVVGAGIVGLCAAWHLTKRGAKVTLIDRAEPGSGCSFGNSASLSSGSVAPLAMPGVLKSAPRMLLDPASPLRVAPGYWLQAAPWLARFVAASRPARVQEISDALAALLRPAIEHHARILREIEETQLLRLDGQLVLYRSHEQLAKDKAVWDLRRRHGHEVRVIDRAGILALEPAVGPAYSVGVYLPDQAMVGDPYRYCQALAGALHDRGADIRREEVRAIEMGQGGVSGVRLSGGRLAADAVVLAAGAWSAQLLKPLGSRIPLESQRGYHITLKETGIDIRRPVVPADRKVFITPQASGLRVGGTVEFAGLDAPPNPARAALLLQDLTAVFPQARLTGARSDWMGHRPCLPDSLPVIGESPAHPGLWLAFGHGHLGLTGAAVTGDVLARAMHGEPPGLDLAPFSAARF